MMDLYREKDNVSNSQLISKTNLQTKEDQFYNPTHNSMPFYSNLFPTL